MQVPNDESSWNSLTKSPTHEQLAVSMTEWIVRVALNDHTGERNCIQPPLYSKPSPLALLAALMGTIQAL